MKIIKQSIGEYTVHITYTLAFDSSSDIEEKVQSTSIKELNNIEITGQPKILSIKVTKLVCFNEELVVLDLDDTDVSKVLSILFKIVNDTETISLMTYLTHKDKYIVTP